MPRARRLFLLFVWLGCAALGLALGCTAKSAAPAGKSAPAVDAVPVVRVIDGDTLVARLDGREERIRVIGLDTPEVPPQPAECYGAEASERAKALLGGGRVRLESDPTQEARDRFGRTLAHIWLPDGRLFAEVMIEEGYGRVYRTTPPHQHAAQVREAEAKARAERRGLWAACRAGG